MKLESILDQIDLGNYALPVFQRGYVWNREQVRKLMNSLYHGYPIGSLLVWVTPTNLEEIKGDQVVCKGIIHLILDGQQRITTLYGIIRGKTPAFFEGNEKAFKNLYFNVMDEVFEFYMAAKMTNNPDWINVSDLMTKGAGTFVLERPAQISNLDKLNTIANIRNVDLPIQEVSGEDKSIDVVVDIFNNVNSGGTKLSKGDLALAKLCVEWSEAREELRGILNWFKGYGFDFSMDWLLRCVTVYITSQPYFTGLSSVNIVDFKQALPKTKRLIGDILNQISSRLGLDHDRVLSGVFAFPVIIQLLKQTDKSSQDNYFWNNILFWYIHTFLWGRFSGSTESILAKDLNVLTESSDIDILIASLRKDRGDLRITPEDFVGWSTGSRFYPLLYMMTRIGHSIDWISGIKLSNALLGKHAKLEVHHIFPKQLLYAKGFEKADVNALANYSFLTQETNLKLSNRDPKEYMPWIKQIQPIALQSHWVPEDNNLWLIENYNDFIHGRQILLANAANSILDNLYNSDDPAIMSVKPISGEVRLQDTQTVVNTDEEEIILNVAAWMNEKGLFEGNIYYELVDEMGNLLTILDLAWPEGVQTGLSEPVALLLNESQEICSIASRAGFMYFTEVEDFKRFIEKQYI